LGLSLGYAVTKLCFFLARGATPRAEHVFRRLQLVSSFFIGVSQGSNDAPKAAGVMIMSLLILQRLRGQNPVLMIPEWVVWVSGVFLALGILRVGWRIVRTVGRKLFRVRTVHAFGAQSATVTIVLLSSLLGFPVSTTQIVTSAVAGAGAADRPKAVHWLVLRRMLITWVFTIPGSGALAAAVYLGTGMLRS
jgi:PiT family inorganic phosphate transporter